MVDEASKKPALKTPQQRRQDRLAQALRENLKRRKAWKEEMEKRKGSDSRSSEVE